MAGAEGIYTAIGIAIALGVAVFVLNIINTINYSSTAQTINSLTAQFGANSGVVANVTASTGKLNSTYNNNLVILVGALVLIGLLVAILLALRSGGFGTGGSGGFMK